MLVWALGNLEKEQKMNERRCVRCGVEIKDCFGFVLARDFLAVIEGLRVDIPRELCGRCVLVSQPKDIDVVLSESG